MTATAPRSCQEATRRAAERALRNALGNLATYAVAREMCDGAIREELPDRLRAVLVHAVRAEGGRFMAAVARTRERLALVQ